MHKKSQAQGKETSITGCLEQSPGGGFRLTNAQSRSNVTPKGTSGTSSAEANVNQTFDLKNGTNLARHVGHKIQVTGYAERATSNQPKGTTGSSEPQTRNFDVRSVKMISSTCP